MKNVFILILFISLFNFIHAMDSEKERESLFANTALSPKIMRAVVATTITKSTWPHNVSLPGITSKKALEEFVKEQYELQKRDKKRSTYENARLANYNVKGWQCTLEVHEIGKNTFLQWLTAELENTPFLTAIPVSEHQAYIDAIVEQYRNDTDSSSDNDPGIKFEKLQEHYELTK